MTQGRPKMTTSGLTQIPHIVCLSTHYISSHIIMFQLKTALYSNLFLMVIILQFLFFIKFYF